MASVTQTIRRRRNRKQRLAAQRARATAWTTGITLTVLAVIVVPLAVVVGVAGVAYVNALPALPDNPTVSTVLGTVIGPTRLYDRTGQTLLYSVSDPLGDDRVWLSLDDLPPYVIDATLIVEDPDYYEATRFDAVGTVSRLWTNLLAGPLRADTSLTGRLVRNAVAPMPDFVTVDDRAREIALVAEINRRYDRDFILEWHLNTNYYGNEAYGIEAASQVYLGKSARDLTLDEAALLASIPTAPELNPVDNETAARGRQTDTLRRLLIADIITPSQHTDASRVFTVVLPDAGQQPDLAPSFSLYARRQAETILDNQGYDGGRLVSRGGLRIVTTLDLDLYDQADCALQTHLNRLDGSGTVALTRTNQPCLAAEWLPTAPDALTNPPDTGQVVVIDVGTGELRAIVGDGTGQDYQPGPALMPYVYFEGFRRAEQGVQYNPATMLLDIPRQFPGATEGLIYTPNNPDGTFSGPVSVRQAVALGLRPPAVEVADNHGLSGIIRTAHRLGLNSLDEGVYDLSLLERGGEASVLDITYSYATFATLGDMIGIPVVPRSTGYRNRDPVAVLRIEDADGTVLWEYQPEAVENRVNVFSSFAFLGYLLNDMLADDGLRREKFGANTPLDLTRPAAVTNGTTFDALDNWTVGYTPYLVVGTHLNRADGSPMGLDGYAQQGAAHVWAAVTEYAHTRENLPPSGWQRPPQVAERIVCELSGMAPNGVCPTRREIMSEDTPLPTDVYWQSVEINTVNRTRATANTPPDLIVDERYFIPPDALMDWWRANGQPLPPTASDSLTRAQDDPFATTSINQPRDFDFVGGTVQIAGTMDVETMDFYQVAYGEGINPQEWFDVGGRNESVDPSGILATWNTAGLDGIYTLRLSVVQTNGLREEDFVQIRIDNLPPSVVLTVGDGSTNTFRWPDQQTLTLNAQVTDNFAVDRVEFYNNGLLIGIVNETPYTFEFGIVRPGTQTFTATAFDEVGNRQQSLEIGVEIVR